MQHFSHISAFQWRICSGSKLKIPVRTFYNSQIWNMGLYSTQLMVQPSGEESNKESLSKQKCGRLDGKVKDKAIPVTGRGGP
jgi:hypothetical protein